MSSPAAAVETSLSAPQRISLRNGVPCPTLAAWMSPSAAVVLQMPSGPVFTTTLLCRPVPGAICC
jgi:hypothetical protein